MLRHMAGLAEIVEDVNEAVQFYHDTLGLQVKDRMGDDYVMLEVPGVLHFGLWNRAAAAESVYGHRDLKDRIPLGFTIEFEADSVQESCDKIKSDGHDVAHEPREEPWGQKAFRMFTPSGGLLGFAETPWGRKITRQLEVEKEND